jgi:D-galactose 1-dehydrogenase
VTISCGIIGYGTIGRLIGDILSTDGSRLRLTAVADPHAQVSHVASFAAHGDLLTSAVEAVVIATPPATHFDIALEALAAGKDVYLEKPPCRTIADAELLVAAAAANGCVLFFGYHARYNPGVQAAKQYLRGQAISAISARYEENPRHFHNPTSWVFDEGIVRDSGVNMFSVVLELVGPDAPITATAIETDAAARSAAPHYARLAYAVGDVALTVHMRWSERSDEIRTYRITTPRGESTVDITRGLFLVDGVPVGAQHQPPDTMRREYERMLADWTAHLVARKSWHGTREIEMLNAVE